MRLCLDCIRLLNKKYQILKDRTNTPQVYKLYDEFYKCLKESEKQYPEYVKMAESLSTGETVFSLTSTEEIRIRLIQLFQKIDLLSNSILTNGVPKNSPDKDGKQSEMTISADQYKLQKNIRLFAVNYLKDFSFQLPPLPTKEQYDKLKEQKRKELMEELERESFQQERIKNLAAKKFQNKGNSSQVNSIRHIDNAAGWVPTVQIGDAENGGQNGESDPIKLQIKLVKGYLEDARKQKRFEEVEILENNLRELNIMISN